MRQRNVSSFVSFLKSNHFFLMGVGIGYMLELRSSYPFISLIKPVSVNIISSLLGLGVMYTECFFLHTRGYHLGGLGGQKLPQATPLLARPSLWKIPGSALLGYVRQNTILILCK